MANTSAPKWDDEEWIVRNIPLNAKLTVRMFDKDDDKIKDDYIGEFEVLNVINYHPPAGGHDIIGINGRRRGQFHLSIFSVESSDESKRLPRFTFDGPSRYFRHNSFAIGRLTMLNANCVYSTWKIPMKRISVFFPPHKRQHWNRQYEAAKVIFSGRPSSMASIQALKIAHKILYGATLKDNENGRLNSVDDLWKSVFMDRVTHRIKPCVYTYVIDDNTWRFSETGEGFFTDFASKHALLANGSEHVRYAGEFHPRPKYGWNRIDDEWELVFDNGSGTYAPSADLLPNLQALMVHNFPGLNIVTYDYKDPELKESMARLKIATEEDEKNVLALKELVVNVRH